MPSYSGIWNLTAVYQAVGQENWPSVDLTRALFFGGISSGGAEINVIDYIKISTPGNATDFGDLTQNLTETSACGSTTRGVVFGGHPAGAGGLYVNVIQYVTFATTGNAASFGTLINGQWGAGACNSSTRGVVAGGRFSTTTLTAIDYITIATTGNTTSFGTLTQARNALGGFSSSTRGVFAGGNASGVSNRIDYITIATTGNATTFGALSTAAEVWCAACSNSTRGLIHLDSSNVIEYVTIATTGNSVDFGDLLASTNNMAASASPSKAVFAGAYAASNVIQYVTIATTGNAIDFGDLTVARGYLSSASNGNGGVQ